jgi:glycosyltransferase involved in cell wall biosynthesis
MSSLISKTPLVVKGYECPECPLGVNADPFASIAMILAIKDKLVHMGFKTVIFLPSEKFQSRMPKTQLGFYRVVVSRDASATLRAMWLRLKRHRLPFLAAISVLRHRVGLWDYLLYEPSTERRAKVSPSDTRRVIFVSTDSKDFPSYYSRAVAAIASACAERGHEVLIVTNQHGREFLGRGFRQRASWLSMAQILRFWIDMLRLRSYFSGYLMRLDQATKTYPSPDGELWSLTSAFVTESSRNALLSSAATILLLDEIFKEFRPDIVIPIPDSSYLGKAAVAIARKSHIPSLTTLAGQIFDHPQYGFLNTDVIAVNGASAGNVFRKRGVSPKRIVVTGMPHYDETFELGKSVRSREKVEGSKLVAFLSENLPLSETFRMITSAAEAVLSIPGTMMIIRPHPRENPSIYGDFVKRFSSGGIKVDSTTPLLELLLKADACVTGFSNVAVEAMILNRPVICMNLEERPDMLDYIGEGAALGVRKAEETASVLNNALFDKGVRAALARGRRAFLKKHFYRTDGKSSLRIVSLIETMTESSRRGRPSKG